MGEAGETKKGGNMRSYDINGRQYRDAQRAKRHGRTEPRFRDYGIPLIVGTVIFILIALFVDPTSMFTLR